MHTHIILVRLRWHAWWSRIELPCHFDNMKMIFMLTIIQLYGNIHTKKRETRQNYHPACILCKIRPPISSPQLHSCKIKTCQYIPFSSRSFVKFKGLVAWLQLLTWPSLPVHPSYFNDPSTQCLTNNILQHPVKCFVFRKVSINIFLKY